MLLPLGPAHPQLPFAVALYSVDPFGGVRFLGFPFVVELWLAMCPLVGRCIGRDSALPVAFRILSPPVSRVVSLFVSRFVSQGSPSDAS